MLDIKLKLRPGHTSERSWMEPSSLQQLFWNVSYACNYRCRICFTNSGLRHPDELTTREGKEMVRKAHSAGVQDIIISGGEPFMRKDIVEILTYMAEWGITARIASNGSLLTDSLLSQLRRETLTKSFQISLDTLNPHLYREIHGTSADSFQFALNSVRRVKDHGFHTTISVRVTPQTLAGIPELIDHAYAEGWSTVTLHFPLHTRRSEGAFPQDVDILNLVAPILEHFLALQERWLIETYIPWAQYHPLMRQLQQWVTVVHRGCSAGRNRLAVHPTGMISPCVCLDVPDAYTGNVRQDDLSTVFQNSLLCTMMRHPQEYGICAECSFVATCGGGCRAAAYVLTKEVAGQDESCPVWLARQSQSSRRGRTFERDSP